MTTYNLRVKNSGTAKQHVAVFQDYPSISKTIGLPLIWYSKVISSGNTEEFKWDINWGLNFGTTTAPLVPGVQYSSKGTTISVEPDPNGSNPNGMKVGYTKDSTDPTGGDFHSESYTDRSLAPGKLGIKTSKEFTVHDADKLALTIYMNGKAAFAVHGKPNGNYAVDTHPTYWIAVTEEKEGVAVTVDYIGGARQFEYHNGNTDINCDLNDNLVFHCQEANHGEL